MGWLEAKCGSLESPIDDTAYFALRLVLSGLYRRRHGDLFEVRMAGPPRPPAMAPGRRRRRASGSSRHLVDL